ncbi:MAG: hypothetical protein WCR72_18470 [Bacteroidota bacterium]
MKSYIVALPWILIVACLIYIGSCTHSGKVKPCPETNDSLRIDTIIRIIDNTKHYAKPKPDTIYYAHNDTVNLYPDSAQCHHIALEYFKHKIYNRHIIIDSIGFIDMQDSVSRNELNGFVVRNQIKQIDIIKNTDHTIIAPTSTKFFAGLNLQSNGYDYFGAYLTAGLKTKKDNIITAGYDPINKSYSIGYYLNFGKK